MTDSLISSFTRVRQTGCHVTGVSAFEFIGKSIGMHNALQTIGFGNSYFKLWIFGKSTFLKFVKLAAMSGLLATFGIPPLKDFALLSLDSNSPSINYLSFINGSK
jgi:hypothetical protein